MKGGERKAFMSKCLKGEDAMPITRSRRRVLGIGLDPYTIDFDGDFFRGKPLIADRRDGRKTVEGGRSSDDTPRYVCSRGVP